MKYKNTGKFLRMKREVFHFTQLEVAKRLEFESGAQFVSNWERGLGLPPKNKLNKICKMYGLERLGRRALLERIMIDNFKMIESEYRKALKI